MAATSDRHRDEASPVGPVVLIGLMASGKSTVGRLVAEATGRSLVDVDDVIQERTGLSVRELWDRGGEGAYRPLERDVVRHVLAEGGPVVLAAPAGAVLDPLVQESFVATRPFVAWLRARPETLAARVGASDHRPLVGDDPLALLTAQHRDRAETYEALADLIVDIDELDAEQVAARLVDGLASGELGRGAG